VKHGHVLAFDFGLKHIGVAVGQAVTRTASPLTTIAAREGTPDWSEVERLILEWQPSVLVVGLPLNMDDSESEMSLKARGFAERMGRRFGVPTELVDERLTSFAARETGIDRPHEAAATMIAESWLTDGN
jgi:putative Holliday junction resolvase